MSSNPFDKIFLCDRPVCERQDLGNDLSVSGIQGVAVELEERDHCQESDTLVAIAVRMAFHEPERVGGG